MSTKSLIDLRLLTVFHVKCVSPDPGFLVCQPPEHIWLFKLIKLPGAQQPPVSNDATLDRAGTSPSQKVLVDSPAVACSVLMVSGFAFINL